MNLFFGIGRLSNAPELRTTTNGISVCTFNIAINDKRDKDKTTFLNVVTWRGLADNCAKFLQKGQQVAVVGEIQIRSYEAKDGSKKSVTEIVASEVEFLSKPTKAAGPGIGGHGDGITDPVSDFGFEVGDLVDGEELPF
jgi:single-strand DNA-binding protein